MVKQRGRRRSETLSIGEVLEHAGVGPTTGDGLVGGGSGVALPDDAGFEPEELPEGMIAVIGEDRLEALVDGASPTDSELAAWREARMEREMAGDPEQFDIWQVETGHGPPAYAVSWRGDDGRPIEYDGLYHDREEIRVMLVRRYGRFELWTD
jgi:hypothetical protein